MRAPPAAELGDLKGWAVLPLRKCGKFGETPHTLLFRKLERVHDLSVFTETLKWPHVFSRATWRRAARSSTTYEDELEGAASGEAATDGKGGRGGRVGNGAKKQRRLSRVAVARHMNLEAAAAARDRWTPSSPLASLARRKSLGG